MASYVRGDQNNGFKAEARRRFRNDIVEEFNSRYDFYTVTPHNATAKGVEVFVRKHFKLLIGKMYRGANDDTSILLAFEKKTLDPATEAAIRQDADLTDTSL